MFAHTFFIDSVGVNSPLFDSLLPLVSSVSAHVGTEHVKLLRVKANLYTNRGQKITHEEHEDYPNLDSYTTAVFNMTTCNGGTKFKDSFSPSIENSLLIFNGKELHSGVTQSDTSRRILINFDYA